MPSYGSAYFRGSEAEIDRFAGCKRANFEHEGRRQTRLALWPASLYIEVAITMKSERTERECDKQLPSSEPQPLRMDNG